MTREEQFKAITKKMRKIIFRGKRKDNGEWVYGWYVNKTEAKHQIVTKEDVMPISVHPETVGQFTGLTDKNGKEVYEGDILSDGKGDNGAVRWIEALGGFCAYVDNTLYSLNEGDPNRSTQLEYTEVIGNIHDNKDLIEKGLAIDKNTIE